MTIGAFTDLGVAGDDTRVFLGEAAGGADNGNYIAIAGVTGLTEDDFILA